jgi:hypothetical protein
MEQLRRFKRANIAPERLNERLRDNLRSLQVVNEDLTELLDNYYLPPAALDAAYRARKVAGCAARNLEAATLAAETAEPRGNPRGSLSIPIRRLSDPAR